MLLVYILLHLYILFSNDNFFYHNWYDVQAAVAHARKILQARQ